MSEDRAAQSVLIQDRQTLELRLYETTCVREHLGVYIWEEGNYGCDCNRGLFFWRARHGIGPDGGYNDPHTPCGHDRYYVLAINVDGQPWPEWTGESETGWSA